MTVRRETPDMRFRISGRPCKGRPFLLSMLGKLLTIFRNMQERNKLLILSLLVGIASGVAAVILLKLIHLIQRLLASALDGSTHALLYLVLPGIGMFISLLLLRYVVKDNISHGVTKVLQAVSRNESRIKPHNMWSIRRSGGSYRLYGCGHRLQFRQVCRDVPPRDDHPDRVRCCRSHCRHIQGTSCRSALYLGDTPFQYLDEFDDASVAVYRVGGSRVIYFPGK